MSTTVLTIYALIWPVIVAIVMVVIGRAFFGDWIRARRRGEDII